MREQPKTVARGKGVHVGNVAPHVLRRRACRGLLCPGVLNGASSERLLFNPVASGS